MPVMSQVSYAHLLAGMCGLAVMIAAGAGHALSEPTASDDVIALAFGFYCDPGAEVEREAPNTVTGTIAVPDTVPQFFALGQTGPATLGIGFGVTAEITERLEGTATIRVEHPPHGEAGVTVESWQTNFSADRPNFAGFSFDYDYELTPGRWRFSASRDGRPIYDVAFEILPEALNPLPYLPCSGPAPIS
ncbi:MAG: DUF3859 domain-containing protein [Pseudomonadota bacterium]